MTPLDRPYPGRPHRVYATLTNHCNRSCPWCSTCSSPRGATFLKLEALLAALPERGAFEVQLEGGEPTAHPGWLEMLDALRDHPRCSRVVLCTNGAVIPRQPERLRAWLARLGEPLTLKLSVNHHLLEHDRGLVDLAVALRDAIAEAGGERLLVVNVRLRPGRDASVAHAVEAAGLLPHANVFELQRYGFARDELDWEPPFLVGHDFRFVNPDGAVLGPDLIARSEAMRVLR
jgi:MoaA/NifB/PqqE/SkfB family radical SAM enzyme